MSTSNRLLELGYGPRWEALFAEHVSRGLVPGRVIRSDRGRALVATEHDVVRAKPATRLLKAARRSWDLPAVGDWVALRATTDLDVPLIEAVLDRRARSQEVSSDGTSDVQVLSANVDVVFVVHPIAQAPNLRRIERELSMAWESGARPVVVLTKADLSADVQMACRSVEEVAFGVDVVATNALAADGAGPLTDFIVSRHTAVLIGPSGAGKSTLVNALLGEARQATREVRLGDGRGRHTTVVRELIAIPSGGVLIDTPGLRALGLTGSEERITSTFPDIEQVARGCRFRRSSAHSGEPRSSRPRSSRTLSQDRLDSFHKLIREAEVAAARTDARLRARRAEVQDDQQGRRRSTSGTWPCK